VVKAVIIGLGVDGPEMDQLLGRPVARLVVPFTPGRVGFETEAGVKDHGPGHGHGRGVPDGTVRERKVVLQGNLPAGRFG
jgi:hypothetical protein